MLFENEPIRKGDVMLVFSHGGLNAAGNEVLIEAKRRGLTTVGVTSMDNYQKRDATHSSGKKLADVADIVIDNCTPAEDAPGGDRGMESAGGGGIDGGVHHDRDVDHRASGGELSGERANAAGICVTQRAGNSSGQYEPGCTRI